jgi:hypothetical protein
MSGGVCLSDDPLEDENDALRAHGDRIVEGLLQYIGEKKLRGLRLDDSKSLPQWPATWNTPIRNPI